MYHDVLQPGDTFSTMMRKVVFTGIGSTGPSSYPIWFTVLAVLMGPREVDPHSTYAFWVNSLSVLFLLSNMATPNNPLEFTLISIILVVLLCKVHSADLILLVSALVISLGRAGTLIKFPFGYDLTPSELAWAYTESIAVFLLTVYGVNGRVHAYLRRRSGRS